jgi:hypothetical protein
MDKGAVVYLILLFSLAFSGCDNKKKNLDFYSLDFIKNQDLSDMNQKDSIVYIRLRGEFEKQKFIEEVNKNDKKRVLFPPYNPTNIKVFHIKCEKECGGSVFSHRISQGVKISKNTFDLLIKALCKPNAMSSSVSSCFSPQIGLVLYNDKGLPFGTIEICLQCNQIRTFPGTFSNLIIDDSPFIGFSKKTRNQIRNILIPYGFHELNFKNIWDN